MSEKKDFDIIAALEAPMSFSFREQSVNEYGTNVVAYIDARQARKRLDDVLGPGGWKSEFETRVTSVTLTNPKDKKDKQRANVPVLFCRISAKINGEWVHREDLGTESNQDPEKGLASDAFKRAAVMWGVGSFLYNIKEVSIPSTQNMKWNNETRAFDIPDFQEFGGKKIKKFVPSVKKGDFKTALKGKAQLNAYCMLVLKLGQQKASELWLNTNQDDRISLPDLLNQRDEIKDIHLEMSLIYSQEVADKLFSAYFKNGLDNASSKTMSSYQDAAAKLMLMKRIEKTYQQASEAERYLIEQRVTIVMGGIDWESYTAVSNDNPLLKMPMVKVEQLIAK